MNEIERFKEEVLKNYPRLTKEDKFTFACHPGVPCFNDCCADVNIFLTPYDIIRLKNHLKMDSQEFLAEHTIAPFDKNSKYPAILLKMREDEKKTCPFVTEKGCSVYEDRPWACRMFPLGLASPGDDGVHKDEPFYFLLQEKMCKGHNESQQWTIGQWLTNQGIDEYDKMGEKYKEITLHKFFQDGGKLPPDKMDMFHMVCNNVDKFRRFLFGTSFFEKFEVDEDLKKKMETDDLALLDFGYQWIRFAIFGEPTMKIREDAAEAAKKKMEEKNKALKKS